MNWSRVTCRLNYSLQLSPFIHSFSQLVFIEALLCAMCCSHSSEPKKGLVRMPVEMGILDLFKVLMLKLQWTKKEKQ